MHHVVELSFRQDTRTKHILFRDSPGSHAHLYDPTRTRTARKGLENLSLGFMSHCLLLSLRKLVQARPDGLV